MSEIKTLNGYSLADTKAREDIAALTEEKMNIVSGTAGQAVGFNAAGQMVAVPFVQYGASSGGSESGGDSGDSGDSDEGGGSTVANNLFDPSVGFFDGYSAAEATFDLDTLDVTPVTTVASTKLYKKAIRLEPGETYAFSAGWFGLALLYNETGGRSGSFSETTMTAGDGCLLYTVPNPGWYKAYYITISFHSSSISTDDMVIVKGTSIAASASTYTMRSSGTSTTYLHDSIKVKGENVVGGSSGSNAAEDASSLFDTLQPTARKIQAYQSPTTLTLTLMSDTHYADDNINATKELKTARLMGFLGDFCRVDLTGNLGDMVPGNVPEEETRSYIAKLAVATLQNAKCPVLFSRGNHDDNGWYSGDGQGGSYLSDEIIDDKEWYQAVWGIIAKHFVNDPNRPYGAYGYYDHEPSKIRVFILNSEDLPYIHESDGSFRYSSYNGHSFSNEQINFVANALQFADKDEPNDWAALFLSHVPLDTTNDDGYRFGIKDALIRGHETMLAVIAAYRKGTSFSYSGSSYNASLGDVESDFMISVDVDYTNKGAGDVIGFISGHTHTDNFSRSVGHENSLSHGYAFLGLMGATDFATFVIDRENGKIASVKYGTSYPDTTAGAVVDAPDTGSITDGEWTVNIDQLRPSGVNLYNGVSTAFGSGYTFDTSGKLDLDTMEMTSAAEDSKYTLSKGIAVKPFTKYAIPSAFNGLVLAFGDTGGRSSYITPVAGTDYKIITTGIRQYNLCFAFHSSYDHSGFAIKEIYDGLVFGQ